MRFLPLLFVVFTLTGCWDRPDATALVGEMRQAQVANHAQQRQALQGALTLSFTAARGQQEARWQAAIERLRAEVWRRCDERRVSLRTEAGERYTVAVKPELDRLQASITEAQGRAARGDAQAGREVVQLKAALAASLVTIQRYADEADTQIETGIARIREAQLKDLDTQAALLPSAITDFDPAKEAETVLAGAGADQTHTALLQGYDQLRTFLEAPGPLPLAWRGALGDADPLRPLADAARARLEAYGGRVATAIAGASGAWLPRLTDVLGKFALTPAQGS